jgi:uncharacterized protein YndB with AHSA1/START domain
MRHRSQSGGPVEVGKAKAFSVPPVVKTIELPVSVEEAFEHYVAGLPHWFPLSKFFAGSAPPKDCFVEARVDGRLYERTADNQEIDWGRVTVWEPPHRFAYTWQVGASEEEAQLVELFFTATEGGSKVVLRHTGWEKLGDKALESRNRYDDGWEFVFGKCYREYVLERVRAADAL